MFDHYHTNPHYLRFVGQLFDFTSAYLRADEADGACETILTVARDHGVGTSMPKNVADPDSVREWWITVVGGMLTDERTIGHTNLTSAELTDTAIRLLAVVGVSISRIEFIRSIGKIHYPGYIDDDDVQRGMRDHFGDDYNEHYDELVSYETVRDRVLDEYVEYRIDDDIHDTYASVGVDLFIMR